jgi:proline iminopeptidase
MSNEANNAQKPIEDENIIRSGRLDVGDGHELYWVDWGNKDVSNPIFYLHGGPGSGFSERSFDSFDPSKQRVIFHDQRGSGRSTPFASTEHNTSADLVSDITKLKTELGFDKISLYGISWGSTLALLYAVANPSVVEKMLIGGIFLARQTDNEFYLQGRISSHFPEVWDRFSALVPLDKRHNVSAYYKAMMNSKDHDERKRFAKEWMMYESSILKLDYQPESVERNLVNFASESLAYLEAHYILNNCFIEENFIINHAARLATLQQIIIVQGRYDFICMPSAAYDLRTALNDNALLHFVMSGHSSNDTVQREVERAYINMLW